MPSLQVIALGANPGSGEEALVTLFKAVEEGRRVRYFSATGLVVTLYRGLADNSVSRVIEQIMKADIVLVDEIGFVSMDDTGVQLFFRVVAAAMKQVGRHR